MIKDDLVNKVGFVYDEDAKKSHNRWIMYPTLWKGKNYLSLHAEVDNLYVKQRESIKFYIPTSYLGIGAQGGEGGGGGSGVPLGPT